MNMTAMQKRLKDATSMGSEYADSVKRYLAEIGRKGGQKSRRKLTKAQARAMVRARTAKRAALRPNLSRHQTLLAILALLCSLYDHAVI
jgi:general stress protein YciG